jgi:site-specific DNA recombinase
MRAAIYSRFSTDRQSESSIADQVRVCTEWCTKNGSTVVAQFEDQGISGAAIGNRPGLQQTLAARVDVLVVMDLTRLSRSQADLPKLIDRLVHRGVRVIGVQDGYDSARKGHKLQAGLAGIMGEAFREMISEKTYSALESRAQRGESAGGVSYGYRDGEADTVRQIFEWYADGTSPRGIAGRLNEAGVASPGAKWNRSSRRHDGKWLASAIHGDPKRETGILNNRRYIGVVTWGRSEWKRSAADSSVRKQRSLEKASVERTDERLRIVSDQLWARVKARQASQSHGVGAKVRAALHRRPSGGQPKYPLSGLLKCSECEASFTLSNALRYQCSSHHEGGPAACEVSLSVPRTRIEGVIKSFIEDELLDTRRLIEVAQRFHAAATSTIVIDHGPRITELERKIQNISNAIAEGFRSDKLAADLKDFEAELARLRAVQDKPLPVPRKRSVGDIERLRADTLERLAKGGDVARATLREIFPDAIHLQPDDSGGHLWAVFPCDEGALRISLLYGTEAERLNALDAAVLAAFARSAEATTQVGTNGSGGRIRTLLARLPRRSFPSKTSAAIAALARWRRRA